MTNIVIQPRLPQLRPQRRVAPSKEGARVVERRWNEIVAAACRDHRLERSLPSYFRGPDSYCGDLAMRVYIKELSDPSTWVCARLHHLIAHVTASVADYRDSAAIAEIGRLLAATAAQLKWDALCDIQLADNLLSEAVYSSRWEAFLRSRQPWHGMQEVIDLRSRVVYLLEMLTMLYDITLRGAAAERLQQSQLDARELQEACEWLGAYAAKLAELNGENASTGGAPRRIWRRRKAR